MNFELGVLITLTPEVDGLFDQARALGLSTCQLAVWTEESLSTTPADKIKKLAEAAGVRISALWAGWPGPMVWDLVEGPLTLGLVPPAYRMMRLDFLMRASDFARHLGVEHLVTHVGFIPENPHDPLYRDLIAALKYLVTHCKSNGQTFAFETGQETPVTLLRAIEDIGMENVGINLDPANLLMYGKANPVDALDVFGQYVTSVHIKDGDYPSNGRSLGPERPVGQGRVDFRQLLAKLYQLNYKGPLTIEREITGPQQIADIKHAVSYLKSIMESSATA